MSPPPSNPRSSAAGCASPPATRSLARIRPQCPKELRVEYKLDGKTASATAAEDQVLVIGEPKPAVIDLPAEHVFQHIRIVRVTSGPPLTVNEIRVFGKFE